jgi:methyltransferase (TIGR00027 family)
MRVNQYSRTALATAYIRAYHSTHDTAQVFDDFLAHRLITREECRALGPSLARCLQDRQPANDCSDVNEPAVMNWWIKVIAGSVLARARYSEDCLAAAVRQGVRQYLILGAGMDTFAFRRPDLMEQIRVFEVDHPETQALKRERLAQAGLSPPASLHFVTADLARESLAAALERSPYDPEALTFFSWLGVTYYLALEDVLATFGALATLASPGSTVVFDYLDAGFFSPNNPHKSVHLVLEKVRDIGEPMQTGFEPADLAENVARLGFYLLEDLSPAGIEEHYFAQRTDGYHAGRYIHFAWASIA